MCSLKIFAVVCLLFSATLALNSTEESIGFPEAEEDPSLVNKNNRLPLYMPSKCRLNELYYPGDQKDDWICDCRPAFLYHPKSDRCWPAYRKGPCQDGEYLVLKSDSAIPVCDKNPCNVDSYVYYKGKCQKFGSIKPCMDMWPIAASLVVNATTLVIHCERLNLELRAGVEPIDFAPCPPGCKRSVTAKCVPISE